MKPLICIDAGHGGRDNGCIAVNGEFEKNINLQVALHLQELSKEYINELDFVLTRTTDEYMGLVNKANFANNRNASLTISIHHNAYIGKGSGAEVIHSINNGIGKEFAEILMNEFLKLGIKKRRVFSRESDKYKGKDYFTIIASTNMPTVISEFCFVDNIDDFKFIDTDEKRKAQAQAILDSVLIYYKIPKKERKVDSAMEDKVLKDYKTILKECTDTPDKWIEVADDFENGIVKIENMKSLKWLRVLIEKIGNK